MIVLGLKVYGHKKLKVNLKDIRQMKAVKGIVKDNTAYLNQEMIKEAKFVGGYSTGRTKQSISIYIGNSGLYGKVHPNTKYSPYLEYGTRLMEKQPFVKPAFQKAKKKFIKDLDKLV